MPDQVHPKILPNPPLQKEGAFFIPLFRKEGLGEIYALFLIVLSLLVPSTVAAHTVHVEQEIGLVLHVDPNDSPIAGLESQVFVELSDSVGHFMLQDCDCVVMITLGDRQITREVLKAQTAEDTSVTFPVTFPEQGDYTFAVSGVPLNGAFEPFTITAPIRVTQPADTESGSKRPSHTPHLIAAFVIAGIVIFDLIRQRLRKRKSL